MAFGDENAETATRVTGVPVMSGLRQLGLSRGCVDIRCRRVRGTIATVAYVLVRGSATATMTQDDFDDAYDELVAEGEIDDNEPKAAWHEFHASPL